MTDTDGVSGGSSPPAVDDYQAFKDQFALKEATSFQDVNDNLEIIRKMGFSLFDMMRENMRITNENFTTITEETNETLNKMAAKVDAILPAQYMAITICIIMIGFIGVTITAILRLAQAVFSV